MSRLGRRMWRLHCYSIGATRFVSDGIPLFNQTLGKDGLERFIRDGGGVTISWVLDQPPELQTSGGSIRFPATPAIHLDSFIESCALRARYRPGIRALWQEEDIVKAAWGVDELITPRVHPEAQLVTFLSREAISVLGDCIGISKPVCWACQCALQPLPLDSTWKLKQGWKMSEFSGKFKDDWAPPPTAAGEKAVDEIARHLAAAVARKLDPVLRQVDGLGVDDWQDQHYDECPRLYPVPPQRKEDVIGVLLEHGSRNREIVAEALHYGIC